MTADMMGQFISWFSDIEQRAVADKKRAALEKGNENLWKKEVWKSPQKNKEIKRYFRDEGAKLGYKSRPSYVTNAGEWLYDFIWREMDANGNMLRLILAMEIELSDRELTQIRYDFNKLLQAEAIYKIMVFQQKTTNETEAVFQFLQNAHRLYQGNKDGQYLLCGWTTSTNSFQFRELKCNYPILNTTLA